MKVNRFTRTLVILVILALNIGCDQVSKSVVRKNMRYDDHIGFLHDHVTLTKIENTGAFLSLGDTLVNPFRFILLTLLPALALGFGLVYILVKSNISKVNLVAIIFILGGGIGNLYDRVVHGSVTDFLHIDFGIFQTGIFNVADMSIMAGMFMILINSWMQSKKDKDEVIAAESEI